MLISASIPLIFEPIEDRGRTLIDGGVATNVPVLPATQVGAKSMIILDPGYPCALDSSPTDRIGFVLHLVSIMIRHQSVGALHFIQDDTQVLYVPPPCPLSVAPHDFSKTETLPEAGYAWCKRFFEETEIAGPGVYGHPHIH